MIKILREHKRIVRNRMEKREDFKQRDYFTSLVEESKSIPSENIDWLLAQANHILIGGLEPDTQLYWAAIVLLTQHPDKLKKLTNEIRAKFDKYEDIEYEELTHLPWLNGAIEESLRLHTNGAFGQPRISPGANVGGEYVPAGVSSISPPCCATRNYVVMSKRSTESLTESTVPCPDRHLRRLPQRALLAQSTLLLPRALAPRHGPGL